MVESTRKKILAVLKERNIHIKFCEDITWNEKVIPDFPKNEIKKCCSQKTCPYLYKKKNYL